MGSTITTGVSLCACLSRFALSALTLALGLCAQSAVHAVALTEAVSPASFADTGLSGTTAALRPELGGTVLEDSIQDFSFEGVTGTVQNRVVRTGAGTLDFSWRINVDPRSTGTGVAAFRLIDFGYEFRGCRLAHRRFGHGGTRCRSPVQ